MAQTSLNDELQEEIETLQSVYSSEELNIINGPTLKIAYTAKLKHDIIIKIQFSINTNDNQNSVIITVVNGEKSKNKLSNKLLNQIEIILYDKYKEEHDSMPIFQCISYCGDDLADNEQIVDQLQNLAANNDNDNENDKNVDIPNSNNTATKPEIKSDELDEIKIPELSINKNIKQYLCKPNKIRTRIGIVGLPNIGKSSFFNLMSSKQVSAKNYPFCTIAPHQCQVEVPCKGFTDLCNLMKNKNKNHHNNNNNKINHIPAMLTIYDIAGLVRGAHEGKGLGNEFLSNIQAVGALYHMVRAFKSNKNNKNNKKNDNNDIQHVEGSIDPIRDLNIISYELRQKDLMMMKKKLLIFMRKLKNKNNALNSDIKYEFDLINKIVNILEKGLDIGCEHSWNEKDIQYIHSYNLFSCKPVVFLVNVSEKDWNKGKGTNKWMNDINEWVNKYYPGSNVIEFCAKYEQKQRKLNDLEWKQKSVVNDVICAGYKALELIHFYTINNHNNSIKCWTIRKGMNVIKASRKINIEIEKNFICVETYSFNDFKKHNYDLSAVKSAGKYTQKGKDYIVKHGDILFFKWNKGSKKSKK